MKYLAIVVYGNTPETVNASYLGTQEEVQSKAEGAMGQLIKGGYTGVKTYVGAVTSVGSPPPAVVVKWADVQ